MRDLWRVVGETGLLCILVFAGLLESVCSDPCPVISFVMKNSPLLIGILTLGAISAWLVPEAMAQVTLVADTKEIPLDTGGTQILSLNAGAAHSLELYLLLGSVTGTVPGLSIQGHQLPLNFDPYLVHTAIYPNTGHLGATFGILSSTVPGPGGLASATFTVPAGAFPSLVGLVAHHAFITWNTSSGRVTLASNAVAVELIATTVPAGMTAVGGGTFVMGDHQGLGSPGELPLHAVSLDTFLMDIHIETIESYCAFLNAAYAQGWIDVIAGIVYKAADSEEYCTTSSAQSNSRFTWDGSTFSIPLLDIDHPVQFVSWYGAVAFANWRSAKDGLLPTYDLGTWSCDYTANGYRLPTEAEREFAMRGGAFTPYLTYPWGNAIDGSHANYFQSGDPYDQSSYPHTTPVGYYDGAQTPSGVDMANGYGLYDTAGNVWEWCADWYGASYYATSPLSNPLGPSAGSIRIVRGGSYNDSPSFLRSSYRGAAHPAATGGNIGFRLVRKVGL